MAPPEPTPEKREGATVLVPVKLTRSVVTQIDAQAQLSGMGRSGWIRAAINVILKMAKDSALKG